MPPCFQIGGGRQETTEVRTIVGLSIMHNGRQSNRDDERSLGVLAGA